MNKITVYGTVSDGVLKLSHRKQFNEDLKQFEGLRVELVISRAKKTRTIQQNRYLFGVVYRCALDGFIDAGHEGVSIEHMHELFKERHLSKGKELILPDTGEIVTVAKSTTELDTIEMNHYIEMIAKDIATWFGIVVPDPLPMFPIEQEC